MTAPTSALNDALSEAVRLRVTAGGANHDGPLGSDVLVDVGEPAAVREMINALAVVDVTEAYCMCRGDLAVEFFGPGRRLLAVVGLHHGSSVRWSGWNGDAELADGHAPLRWLAAQGCAEPLARQQSLDRLHAEQREQMRLAEANWRNAAPAAVQDLLDPAGDMSGSGGSSEAVKLEVALRLDETIVDGVQRAAVTLAWYGSGTGRCTGYPTYEALPELALRELSIDQLIEAIQTHPGDAAIEAGAIRHLCGWKKRTHQARDIARIPSELRLHLLQVAQQSSDADKRDRAEKWLNVPAD